MSLALALLLRDPDRINTGALWQAVRRKDDVLLILPTGGGKSLAYQLPPLLTPAAFAVVISPLIALAKVREPALAAAATAPSLMLCSAVHQASPAPCCCACTRQKRFPLATGPGG